MTVCRTAKVVGIGSSRRAAVGSGMVTQSFGRKPALVVQRGPSFALA
jgi:hypothetical protein